MTVITIPELPGKGRLGRHIQHDPASRAFSLSPSPKPLVSIQHVRHCSPFTQGNLGSCTGMAMAGALMTGTLYDPTKPELTEKDAEHIYSEASLLDDVPGHWPPEDTGSTGLGACKAAKRLGYVTSYQHPFGLAAVLSALCEGPLLLGMDWYEGFDEPDPYGEVRATGTVRGGHEVCLSGINVEGEYVRFCNSWGTSYGTYGYGVMTFALLDKQLKNRGDAVRPVR